MFIAEKPSLRIDLQLLVDGVVAAEFDAAIWEPVDANSPGRTELACATTFEALAAGPYQLRGVLGNTTLTADGVWLKAFEREHHPDRRHARPTLYLDQIYELNITQRYGSGSEEHGREMEYFLTPCKLLNPASIAERYPNGQVNRTTVHRIEFQHPSLGQLAFDQRHGLVETEPGVKSETTTLALKLDGPVPASASLQEVDTAVREALLVAGFAARYPTRVWGRQCADGNTVSRTYFQALSSWTPHWSQPPRDELVYKAVLPDFLTQALSAAAKLSANQQESTRQALVVVRSQHGTLEDQFRSVFSALEGLCVAFDDSGGQRLSAAEKAQNRKIRQAVQAALDALKASDPSIDVGPTQRRLDRTSAPPDRRFRSFIEAFDVPVADLWPAYRDGTPGLDLYSIRNRLSHGAPFSETDMNSIHVALEHLKLLVERCVLRIFGWDVSASDASPTSVSSFMSSNATQQYRAALV